MSYLLFHIFFILPPILLLARKGPLLAAVGRRAGLGLLLMALVALAYTTPWDNYLVYQEVWDYGEDQVVGTIGYVPLEEYLFFVLQPLLAGLWLYWLLGRESEPITFAWEARRSKVRLLGTLFWLAAILLGVLMLQWNPGYYLGLILVWAGPVLAGQWAYGGDVVWKKRRSWALGVAVPTVYLWIADRLALSFGIWRLSEEHTTGLGLFGLPMEEAVFFAVTNLMVVQGLLLFLAVSGRLHERVVRRRVEPPHPKRPATSRDLEEVG